MWVGESTKDDRPRVRWVLRHAERRRGHESEPASSGKTSSVWRTKRTHRFFSASSVPAAASRGSRWSLVARDRARRVARCRPRTPWRPSRRMCAPEPRCSALRGVCAVHAAHFSREKLATHLCCLCVRTAPLSLAQWLANELETKHYLMAQAQGSHLPMQIRMELEQSASRAACPACRPATLPPNASSGATRRSTTRTSSACLASRRLASTCTPRSTSASNLGPRSSLHGKMAAADGAPPVAVEAPRANVATVKLGMGGL